MTVSPRLQRTLFILVGLSFLPAILGWLAANWAFHPSNRPVPELPSAWHAESVYLRTADDVTLRAWFIPPRDGAAPRAAALLLHERGGTRASMAGRAGFLSEHGFAVLAPDLRGEGESESVLRGMGVYESRDAIAALAELRRRVGDVPTAIVGRSKGAAAAVYAHPGVDALVLESLYADLTSAIRHRLETQFGAWAGPWARFVAGPFAFGMEINLHEAAPVRHLAAIRAPVMIIAGDRDPLIPWSETEQIYAAAPGSKQLWRVEGAGHDDFYRVDEPGWQARVGAFLDAALAPAAHKPPVADPPAAAHDALPADVPRDVPVP